MSPADILWVGVAVVDDVAYPMQGLVTPQRGSYLGESCEVVQPTWLQKHKVQHIQLVP